MFERYPIHELIESRLTELGIRRSELACRCGFRNVAKGLRRIDQVCKGQFNDLSAEKVLAALPTAVEIDKEVVASAIQETIEIIQERDRRAAADAEVAWRASFKPHGYLLGERTRPIVGQITIYAVSGGSARWLRIPIDGSKPTITFAAQALAVVRKTPTTTFFGKTTGFIINYSPDHSIRFNVDGEPLEQRIYYKPGDVVVTVANRDVTRFLSRLRTH